MNKKTKQYQLTSIKAKELFTTICLSFSLYFIHAFQ